MAQLMVLAAGLGSRLRPLTDELPKPLVPVGDAPLLEHILRRAAALGLDAAVVNAFWCRAALHAFGATWQRTLTILDEPELLGTAGGVRHALPSLNAPVLVWNGDIWATPELAQWQAAAHRKEPTLFVSTLASGATHDDAAFPSRGTVGVDAQGCVARLRGENFGHEVSAVNYVGLMVLPSAGLDALPEQGCLVADFLLPWLRSGRTVHTQPIGGSWADVGSLESYVALNRSWLQANGQFYAGAGSHVADGVHLERTILGSGASVNGAGRVTDCIVWPGAQLSAPLHGAIVTTSGRVVHVAVPSL